MNINNYEYTPPAQVRQLFYNCIPFGSDYLIYTKSYTTQNQIYECIVRHPVSHVYHVFRVNHVSGGDYTFSEVDSTGYDLTSLSVDMPYYAYSSFRYAGIRESLPISGEISTFLLIVIASLLVLKTVFGGIKLWTNRRKRSSV